MGYIKDNLSRNETIVNEIKLSKLGLINPILWVVLTLGFGLPVAIFKFLRFKTIEQVISDKKVMKKEGIISRDIDEMRLSKIETVEFKQSILGRIFNYGNVVITGTGGAFIVFQFVSDPKKVKNEIDNLID
tara:strand:+ start:2289 stop:2681 length:393 start_codon:yes stop_codon:yes gene_type:complete